mgnify:CR=1 FL=1
MNATTRATSVRSGRSSRRTSAWNAMRAPESASSVRRMASSERCEIIATGIVVALASTILDDDETYDLTNIGTLFAFLVVCLGVLALRIKDPDRPRPFRVPFVWVVAPLGALACIYVMFGLPITAWVRFGVWMLGGLVVYFAFGYRNARLVRAGEPGS